MKHEWKLKYIREQIKREIKRHDFKMEQLKKDYLFWNVREERK
jgi:hypothetical protein